MENKSLGATILAKRITITPDNDLNKKLHGVQTKQIKGSKKVVSFSKVLNETLRQNLK